MISPSTTIWGNKIAVEFVRGVPFSMYTQRPHRLETLLAFADRWGTRAHIVQGESILTFQAMRRVVAAKAAVLRELGIGCGDRVLLLGWNGPDWVVNLWACIQLGAIPVLANAWWSKAEISNALDMMQPALTLADDYCAAKMPPASRCGPWTNDLSPTSESGEEGTVSGDAQTNEEDPAVIMFTSGTAGRPKAAILSHRALLASLQMMLHITRRLPHQIDESAGDVALHTGPLFHIGGLRTLLRAVTVGDTLVMPGGKFDPAGVLEMVERHKVVRWNAVPTMVSRVLEHPDVRRRDLSSLKSLTLGGAPVHSELVRRIRDGLPGVNARIPTGYGLTENGGQATAASGDDTEERPGSSGRVLPCVELRILPRPGLPDGEILLRAPTQMTKYYGTDESPIDAEGWLHSGDLGHVDDAGHVWITGRSKDMIIRGGENIAPAAVENALMAIPGVVEAAVFGIPHVDLGEEVMAAVVLDRDISASQIKQQLQARVASFSVPSRWRLQTQPLPVNQTGKIDKSVLRTEACAEMATRTSSVA